MSNLVYRLTLENRHHLWYSRRVYRKPAANRLRGAPCMIPRISFSSHEAIHGKWSPEEGGVVITGLYLPPRFPDAGQLAGFAKRHIRAFGCQHKPESSVVVNVFELGPVPWPVLFNRPCARIKLNPYTFDLVQACYRPNPAANPERWAARLENLHVAGACPCHYPAGSRHINIPVLFAA